MFRPQPGVKYDMPPVFGPSPFPDRSTFDSVTMVSTSFVTTLAAASVLVPHHFRLPNEPVVTISRMTYDGVDYLGGRGYHELTVGISAIGDDAGHDVVAPYMPVVWISDSAALIAGREHLGYAKLGAALPPVVAGDGWRSFEVAEYGTRLLRGRVDELVPLASERLERVRRASTTTTVLGWKYVAGLHGRPDADYPTAIRMSFDWSAGWGGVGGVTFDAPTPVEAPFSSRIVSALAALPVVRPRPVLVAEGRGRIDRLATTRLTSAGAGRSPEYAAGTGAIRSADEPAGVA